MVPIDELRLGRKGDQLLDEGPPLLDRPAAGAARKRVRCLLDCTSSKIYI